jgi:hypothetical protein
MSHHSTALDAILWVVAAVTVVTGLQYVLDARRAANVAQVRGTSVHASSKEVTDESPLLGAADDHLREAAR